MSNKIKTQKHAAKVLTFVPMIILVWFLMNTDLDKHTIPKYIICASLLVLIICGVTSLSRSLRK
jgi:hypothetical protein